MKNSELQLNKEDFEQVSPEIEEKLNEQLSDENYTGAVFIIADITKVFDFINDFEDESKKIIYKSLKELEGSNSKLIYLLVEKEKNSEIRTVYHVIIPYAKGLIMMYSENMILLCSFLRDYTNIDYDLSIRNFENLKE